MRVSLILLVLLLSFPALSEAKTMRVWRDGVSTLYSVNEETGRVRNWETGEWGFVTAGGVHKMGEGREPDAVVDDLLMREWERQERDGDQESNGADNR